MEQGTYSAWSKSQGRSSRLGCYICQSEEHLKRDCPRYNHKKSQGFVRNEDQVFGSGDDGYDNVDVMMAMSVEELLDWIIDSGSSYYITYKRDYLVDFKEYDSDNILLGDGRECRVRGTEGFIVKMQSGKIKVIKGSLVVLSGTRRANCVYTVDGQALTRNTLKGRKQLGECQTWWKINTVIQQQNGLVKETNMTLLAKVRCFLIQSGLSKVLWAEDTTISTYLVNKVLQGVKFEVELQEDHTFEVEPHGNVDHVAGSQEVQTQDLIYYHSARDREKHLAWELFSYREDSNEGAFVAAAVEKIYAYESLTFNNTVAYDLIFKWKVGLKDDMDSRTDVYLLSNGCKKCSDDSDGYYWEYTPGMFIHLFLHIDDMVFLRRCKAEDHGYKRFVIKLREIIGMEIVRDQSGNTLRVSQSRFYSGKLVQTLLEGHSILSLEGSLSGDYDVEKNGKCSCIYAVGSQEYRVVCTRLDIASADVGMLDKFDRGLQTDVHVFVDFDYVMGRSITVMGRSITCGIHDTYGGCKGGYLAKVTCNRVRIRAKDGSGLPFESLSLHYDEQENKMRENMEEILREVRERK
ncbi:zinc finger, CCHC-type containing protein, partial [Tanacetum coccineum]